MSPQPVMTTAPSRCAVIVGGDTEPVKGERDRATKARP